MEIVSKILGFKIIQISLGLSIMYAVFMMTDQLAPDAAERVERIRILEENIAQLQVELDECATAREDCKENWRVSATELACWETEFKLDGCQHFEDARHKWSVQRITAGCKR